MSDAGLWEATLTPTPPDAESHAAYWMAQGAEGAWLDTGALKAYWPGNLAEADVHQALGPTPSGATLALAYLPPRNWNAEWEASYPNLTVGKLVAVHPPFRPAPAGVAHTLAIEPGMAFGTGHHPTTQLMLGLLARLPLAGRTVLDLGAGTGVLALLARRLGAGALTLVDTQPEAAQAAQANALRNGVDDAAVVLGTLADVPPGPPFDLVLANITRNVLVDVAPALAQRTAHGGYLALSGCFGHDEAALLQAYRPLGFHLVGRGEQGGWLALALHRP